MDNMKWLLSRVKTNKLIYSITVLLLTLESGIYIYAIRLQQTLIDSVIIGEKYHLFFSSILAISICYITFSILYVLNPFLQAKIYGYVKKVLTEQSLNHLSYVPVESIENERSGRFLNHLTNEVSNVSSIVGHDMLELVRNFSLLIITSFFMIRVNEWMFIALVLLSAFYYFFGTYFSKRRKKIMREIQIEKNELVVFLTETVSSTKDVIVNNNQTWLTNRYQSVFNKFYNSVLKDGKLLVKQIITQEFFSSCAYVFVLGISAYLIILNEITIGMLVVTYQLTTELIDSSQKCCNGAIDLYGKTAVVERVRTMISNKTNNSVGNAIHSPIYTLELENVTYSYQSSNVPVINDLSLVIPTGKKIAFVGLSGSGKSTITYLLNRFYQPDSGRIMINRNDINSYNIGCVREKINVVFQDPYIFNDTIRNNILMGENIDDQKLIEICKLTHIYGLVQSLPDGFDTYLGERGTTLSGGEKQRIALARSLIKNSEVLILDEATSALDYNTEKVIQKNIDSFRSGKTTIVIAHRLSTIKDADMICVLKDGQIIQVDSHYELLSSSKLYKSLVAAETAS
jgi:ABC-type multidrug transport system fused ATPase/permease subunit